MKKQLPSRPNLEQLRNQAKTMLRGFRAADPSVLREIREHLPLWAEGGRLTLSDAQMVVARQHGFASWAKLKTAVLLRQLEAPDQVLVNALRAAAGRGDLAQLNELLDAHPQLIDETGGAGVRTALHQAVFGAQEGAVRLLLERGANPNIRCEGDNAYPLHFAVEKQNFPIIRLLVEHGGDVVGEGDYHELGVPGWATAWEYIEGRREIVDYLLAHGATHNIFSAVATGDVAAIHELEGQSRTNLDRRMDLANRRRMPVHLAVVKKQAASLAALMELGANLESLDEAGLTALDEAGLRGETAMAQALLEHGAKVRLPAAFGLRRTRDVEKLLRRNPQCLRPGERWSNLIVRASEVSSGAVVEALILAGASVDVRDDPKTAVDSTSGYTPLHAAAFRGNVGAASALLRHGAKVFVREEKYRGTPAGWANFAGQAEVRDLILQGPVDIMEAVEFGLIERIAAILEQDPAAIDRPLGKYPLYPMYAEAGQTPLAFARAQGREETARWLADRGAKS